MKDEIIGANIRSQRHYNSHNPSSETSYGAIIRSETAYSFYSGSRNNRNPAAYKPFSNSQQTSSGNCYNSGIDPGLLGMILQRSICSTTQLPARQGNAVNQ
jgi:hypothetical protein